MFKRLNFIKKNMLFSALSVILVGIILISISYIVEINSLVSQLHEQSKKMTEKWYNEIKVEDVKKAKESSSIETKVQKKLTKYFDEISEYNPNIAQAYIYGTELKNGNQTSIIAFPSHVWKLFKKYNLKLGDMYEQPENVVQALKKLKETKKAQFTDIYQDDFGTWVTIMYPIVDENGKVFAYFAVDIDASHVKKGEKQLLINLIIVLIVVLVLVLIPQYIYLKKSLKPLVSLVNGIEKVGNGNLNFTINTNNSDLGKINEQFNKMIQNLKLLIIELKENSKKIRQHSDNLKLMSEENYNVSNLITKEVEILQDNISHQENSINEIANAIEQISSEIENIATNANDLYNYTSKVTSLANNGKEYTEKVVSQMSTISDTVEKTYQVVNNLSSLSDEIGKITDVITEIASETNLLSLNANIEAARVGEAGRGFAVVAQEVKKLSEQSEKSASEIKDLIQKVQTEINSIVKSMEEGKNEVKKGKELVSKTNEVFEDIYDSVNKVSNRLEEVSASSQQISSSVEEVTSTVLNIAENARKTSDGYSNIVAKVQEQLSSFTTIQNSSQELNNMSKKLEESTNKFIIE